MAGNRLVMTILICFYVNVRHKVFADDWDEKISQSPQDIMADESMSKLFEIGVNTGLAANVKDMSAYCRKYMTHSAAMVKYVNTRWSDNKVMANLAETFRAAIAKTNAKHCASESSRKRFANFAAIVNRKHEIVRKLREKWNENINRVLDKTTNKNDDIFKYFCCGYLILKKDILNGLQESNVDDEAVIFVRSLFNGYFGVVTKTFCENYSEDTLEDNCSVVKFPAQKSYRELSKSWFLPIFEIFAQIDPDSTLSMARQPSKA